MPVIDDQDAITRLTTACEWMYEYCARNGMEDAKAGILRSMRKQFQLNEDTVRGLSDPFETAKRLVESGEYVDALQALELCLGTTEGMDTSASSKHFGVQLLLKVHMCLDYLKGKDPNAKGFRDTINELFPAGKKGRRPPAAKDEEAQFKMNDRARKRLLEVADDMTPEAINNLLDEHPPHELRQDFDSYVSEAHNLFQGPTMLERIYDDINSGKYDPNEKNAGGKAAKSTGPEKRARPRERQRAMESLAEEPKEGGGKRTKAVAHVRGKDKDAVEVIDEDDSDKTVAKGEVGGLSTKAKGEEEKEETPAKRKKGRPRKVPASQEEEAAEERPTGAKRKVGRPRNEAVKEQDKDADEGGGGAEDGASTRKRKAWTLRDAMELLDEGCDFTEVHKMTHGEVAAWVDGLEESKRARVVLPASKLGGGDVDTETEGEEAGGEEGSSGDEEATRELPKGSKPAQRGSGKAGSSPAKKGGGKENSAPAAVKPRESDSGVVKDLAAARGTLHGAGSDPLAAILKGASAAGGGGSRKVELQKGGGKLGTFGDEEEDEAEGKNLSLPPTLKNVYNPKSSLGSGPEKRLGMAATGDGQKYHRWSEEEVEQLNLGVKTHGVGKWAMILEGFTFQPGRTAVHLKDKWRNLTK